mmetsp:Transcript_15035/g.26041  ORF Transcript_15035/g.26041 Transcript_15035/m.26041 type:complete len:275 (-) Transcript_15035:108-932(-)
MRLRRSQRRLTKGTCMTAQISPSQTSWITTSCCRITHQTCLTSPLPSLTCARHCVMVLRQDQRWLKKRRRLSKDVEPERAYEVPATVPSGPSRPVDFVEEPSILTEEQRNNLTLSVKQKAAGKPAPPSSSPFAPLLGPVLSPERAGLRSFSLGISPDTPVVTETVLLENAPGSMNAVVTGNQDDEDQSGNPAARIGYSSRTEKMHRFLAKEFRDSGSQDLSYEEMCRSQTEGRRDLIAGCFFELLVLKTNGVINVQQEDPQSDIKIAKAGLWAK